MSDSPPRSRPSTPEPRPSPRRASSSDESLSPMPSPAAAGLSSALSTPPSSPRVRSAAAASSSAAAASHPSPRAMAPPPETDFMMGMGGLNKHTKRAEEKQTTVPRKVKGRRGKPSAMVNTTVRNASTLQRHMARLKAGHGRPTGRTVPTGMGNADVFELSTSTPGRAPSLYARKPDGGTFPLPPSDGLDYESSDDESGS